MTCESFEWSTGRCRKRGGSGCSIGFLRGRKRVLVMVMIMVLLLTSVVPLVPLNPIDANYSGTKYTVVYHKDVGSGTTVEVEYRGSFISTEYNPQFWKGTIGASGGKILEGSDIDWTNDSKVFAGWGYYENYGTEETAAGIGHLDPGDILNLNGISSSDTIHLYAKWSEIENSVTIHSDDSYSTIYGKLWNISSNGNPYTNIIRINGTIDNASKLDIIFGKAATIRGYDLNSQINIGGSNSIINANIIIDQIKLIGLHQPNHGDGVGGLFANGHKLIIGTEVDTGKSESVTDYPQLFGGGTRNGIIDTSLIVHSGVYGNIFGGSGSGGAGIERDTKVVLRNVTVLDTLAGGSASGAGNISGSTNIYATSLYIPGDFYEEEQLDPNGWRLKPKLTESTIITGGSNGSSGNYDQNKNCVGSTNIHLSGDSEVWDVQGGGRRGDTRVGSANLVISGNALVKHIACGGITDGMSSVWTGGNVGGVNLVVKDDAKVAMLLGGGYDTWGPPSDKSTVVGQIAVSIEGGTVGYVYGGGFRGVVGSNATTVEINISGGTILKDVYGGGRGGFDKILHENDGTLGPKENNGFKDTTGYSKLTAESINITVGKDAVVEGSVYGGGQSTPVINSYNGKMIRQDNYHNEQLLNVAGVDAGSVVISIEEGTVNGSVYTGGKGIDTSLFTDTTSSEYMEWTKIIGMKGSGELGYIPWFVGSEDKVLFKEDVGTYDSFASSSSASTAASRSVTVTDGIIGGSVYGGGMGLKNNTVAGKVQAGLINLTIGTSTSEPTIKGSVYGGGAYSFTVSEIAVVINNGIVHGNVFSGGLGTSNSQTGNSHSTAGNRTLKMNGGRVKGSVFGSSSYGNDGSSDVPRNTKVEISAGIIDGSVYGAGFKGVTYGNTKIIIQGKARIGMSVYGGADVGKIEDATVEEIKVTGGSTINIDGTGGASVAGSVFGSGNSCLVDGEKMIRIKGLNSGTAMASIQNADKVDIEGSRLILAGRAAGTSSSATTKYSLNNIEELNLADGTYMELRARVNDIGKYHSRVAVDGADTSSSNPKNTIRLAEGRSFEVRKSDVYKNIHGYTILSLNPAELYYGAFAYGSNESPGGFVIEREGTYIKADTQDFGENCRLWFISGAVLRTTTLVATNTGVDPIEVQEPIHRISADTHILYTGHVLSVSQTPKMNLVEGAPAAEGEYKLTFGHQGTNLMTFGRPDIGTCVSGMYSIKEVVGEGGGTHVRFKLEYYPPKYSGFAGTVHLSFIEAVKVTLAGGETGYLHQNRIDYRIDVYTDASENFGGEYTVPIVLRGGNGSGEFVIPRSFYDYRLVLENFDLSKMPGASLRAC